MQIVQLEKANWNAVLKKVRSILENDGLVVFPSDTVYGLAANAASAAAVNKLLAFKDRPLGKAISVALPAFSDFEKYVEVSPTNRTLLETLLPGPFTVILPSKHTLVKALEAENGTLGIRLPDNSFVHDLCKSVSFPITATSANITGKGPHYSVSALIHTLSEKKKQLIDLIVNAGSLPHNPPSTVLNLSTHKLELLRTGEFNPAQLLDTITHSEQETKLLAQQLLLEHQSHLTRGPLVFILKGDLGTGKTIFTKGIGELLNITNVVSPTFVIYYEYNATHELVHKLHHFDLYRAEQPEDLSALGIENALQKHNLLVFEWGERTGALAKLFRQKNAQIILVNINEVSPHQRRFQIFSL